MNITLYIGFVVVGVLLLVFCRRLRVLIRRHETVIKLAMAFFAACYVLVEYSNVVEERKVKESLDYIQRGESGEIANAKIWIDHFKLRYAKKLNEGLDSKDPNKFERIMSELEEKALEEEGAGKRVIRLFHFYADVAACTETEICNSSLLCGHYLDDIGQHYMIFANLIDSWQEIAFRERMEKINAFIDSCSDSHRKVRGK